MAIHVPDHVLPAPEIREIPPAAPLRRMLGPSIILAGLSVGSGEFVLWPRLVVEHGFVIFWAAWIGVTIQFFLNLEIERWTLATGESAVTGFFRLSKWFGPVFLLCATVPWIWPGWATGAAQIITWETELDDGAVPWLAVGGLVLCGAILSLGPVVYRTVERLMAVLVTAIFVALLAIAFWLVDLPAIRELLAGAMNIGHLPEGIHLPVFLGALAFAGAGGALNLAQSNYIKDKGFGMGAHVGRITSPFTGREEAASDIGYVLRADAEGIARFRLWWRRANIEHFFSFFVLCLLSLALFCLVAHVLRRGQGEPTEGFGFIRDQAEALRTHWGGFAGHAFLGTGVLVLFTTELALLDGVSRVAADTLKVPFFRDDERVTSSRLYFIVLWSLIAFGATVLLVGFDQPFQLLVISAALNGFVMFLYSGLLLVLNAKTFRGPLRPHPVRLLALGVACAFFGYFSILTLMDKLGL